MILTTWSQSRPNNFGSGKMLYLHRLRLRNTGYDKLTFFNTGSEHQKGLKSRDKFLSILWELGKYRHLKLEAIKGATEKAIISDKIKAF
jgi:hypothetical protein